MRPTTSSSIFAILRTPGSETRQHPIGPIPQIGRTTLFRAPTTPSTSPAFVIKALLDVALSSTRIFPLQI